MQEDHYVRARRADRDGRFARRLVAAAAGAPARRARTARSRSSHLDRNDVISPGPAQAFESLERMRRAASASRSI